MQARGQGVHAAWHVFPAQGIRDDVVDARDVLGDTGTVLRVSHIQRDFARHSAGAMT